MVHNLCQSYYHARSYSLLYCQDLGQVALSAHTYTSCIKSVSVSRKLETTLFMGCLVLELVLALGATFHYALYLSILQPIEPISLTPKPD